MTSEGYHEPVELLSQDSLERHRAIVSLMEELEAVDWYAQRVDASRDPELKAILQHNLEEEVEHAAMVLEWLRRRNPKFDEELRGRLFREGSIVEEGHDDDHEGEDEGARGDGSLGIGSLKGR